jgi:hypothetical protein
MVEKAGNGLRRTEQLKPKLMRTKQISMWLATGLVLAGTLPGRSAPMPKAQVPADAVWYLHLDIDKLKTTQIGQWFMGELDKPEAQQKLASFQAIFNFDPRQKIKDCTLFSRGNSPEDAVLILRGTFDTGRLATLARMGKEYKSRQHRDYTIHGWLDESRKTKAGGHPRSYGAIHTTGAVVLGQKPERVGEALDVMDGILAGLDKGKLFAEAAAVQQGAVLVGAARRTEGAQFAPNVEIFRHFKTMNLAANEGQDQLGVELGIEAESEDAARNLQAMAQGLLAWTAIQGDKTGASRWLQGLSVAQKGAQVSASLKLPTVDVIQMLKDGQGRKARPR